MKPQLWCVVLLFVGCGTVSQPVDDGGIADAGVADAGAPDAGARDAESPDGGATDAGQADAGVADAGEVFDGGSPCDLANGGCDPLTTCDDTDGGVTCSPCPAGYVGAGATGCVNVDECAPDGGASCGLRTCIDTPGAYQCGACIGGYTDDGGTCVDIDECALDAGVCHRLTTCTNSVGDFSCSDCPGPYATGNGRTGCVQPAAFVRYATLPSARSISLCTVSGRGLPINYGDVSIIDNVIESAVASYDLTVSGSDGGMPRVVVTDIASGMIVSSSTTHFSGRGTVFDIDIMQNASNVISMSSGRAVFTMRYCRVGYGVGCVELRDDITFADSSSTQTVACDPPPLLAPTSDLGAADDDDVTSDFTPTFTVSSTAQLVTWLRDDVVMASTPVVNGMATWTDDGTAAPGMHGYSVQHGPNAPPSARRHVLLTTLPAQTVP